MIIIVILLMEFSSIRKWGHGWTGNEKSIFEWIIRQWKRNESHAAVEAADVPVEPADIPVKAAEVAVETAAEAVTEAAAEVVAPAEVSEEGGGGISGRTIRCNQRKAPTSFSVPSHWNVNNHHKWDVFNLNQTPGSLI